MLGHGNLKALHLSNFKRDVQLFEVLQSSGFDSLILFSACGRGIGHAISMIFTKHEDRALRIAKQLFYKHISALLAGKFIAVFKDWEYLIHWIGFRF